MKKLFLVLLAFAVFIGCKKSETKPTQASIVGKWYSTVDTARLYVNGVAQTTQVSTHDHTEGIQFNSDGTGIAIGGGDTSNFTYSVSGSNLTITTPAQTSGGVTSPATSSTVTIELLTSATLSLFVVESNTNNGGQTEKTTDIEYFSK